jgi:hypothetical protein
VFALEDKKSARSLTSIRQLKKALSHKQGSEMTTVGFPGLNNSSKLQRHEVEVPWRN